MNVDSDGDCRYPWNVGSYSYLPGHTASLPERWLAGPEDASLST